MLNLFGLYYASITYTSGLHQLVASIGIIIFVLFGIIWFFAFSRFAREKVQSYFAKKIKHPIHFYNKHNFLSAILELERWHNIPIAEMAWFKKQQLAKKYSVPPPDASIDDLEHDGENGGKDKSVLKGLMDGDVSVEGQSCKMKKNKRGEGSDHSDSNTEIRQARSWSEDEDIPEFNKNR